MDNHPLPPPDKPTKPQPPARDWYWWASCLLAAAIGFAVILTS